MLLVACLPALPLLAGCTGASAEGPTLPPDLAGTMTVEPGSAAPGEVVTLRFPPQSVRGIAFVLSRWDDGDWTEELYLTSDWGDPARQPGGWWRVEDSVNRGWAQVAVEGAGPDRVVVPDAAQPGDHLLCTANAVDRACALLTVTD
jgi:hypothetical protein